MKQKQTQLKRTKVTEIQINVQCKMFNRKGFIRADSVSVLKLKKEKAHLQYYTERTLRMTKKQILLLNAFADSLI